MVRVGRARRGALLGRDRLIAAAAVEQMPLHRRARVLGRARLDGVEDIPVLALERAQVDAARRRLGRAPDGAARNDEAAEIFQEAAELRIAGAVGDGAMEGEILVDGVAAALDRRLDRLVAL